MRLKQKRSVKFETRYKELLIAVKTEPCLFQSCKKSSDLLNIKIIIFAFGLLISKFFAAYEPLGYSAHHKSKILLRLGTLFFGISLINIRSFWMITKSVLS